MKSSSNSQNESSSDLVFRAFLSEVGDKNRVTLPSPLCKAHRVTKGSRLAITAVSDKQWLVTLRNRRDEERAAKAALRSLNQKVFEGIAPTKRGGDR